MRFLIAVLTIWPALAQSNFRATFETTAGEFALEVHYDWAPLAAGRFEELVREHYFDDSRFFRVVAGKWVQFGIAGRPEIARRWRNRTIADDPVKQSNTLGYAGFANTGPGTRSTQIYINLGDNSRLDKDAWFAPFAKVISGMDVVEKLYSGYGETSGGGMRAGKQDRMFSEGNAYLDREFPKLDRIIRVAR